CHTPEQAEPALHERQVLQPDASDRILPDSPSPAPGWFSAGDRCCSFHREKTSDLHLSPRCQQLLERASVSGTAGFRAPACQLVLRGR
ncbi:hypothetical protein P7K49_020564, partial [Saguinus oedipus]